MSSSNKNFNANPTGPVRANPTTSEVTQMTGQSFTLSPDELKLWHSRLEQTTPLKYHGKRLVSLLDPLVGLARLVFAYPEFTNVQMVKKKIGLPTIVPFQVFAHRYVLHTKTITITNSELSAIYGELLALPCVRLWKDAHYAFKVAYKKHSPDMNMQKFLTSLVEYIYNYVQEQVVISAFKVARSYKRDQERALKRSRKAPRSEKPQQPTEASSSAPTVEFNVDYPSFYGPGVTMEVLVSAQVRQPPKKLQTIKDYQPLTPEQSDEEPQAQGPSVSSMLSNWLETVKKTLPDAAISLASGIVSFIAQCASIWLHTTAAGRFSAVIGFATSITTAFPQIVSYGAEKIAHLFTLCASAWHDWTKSSYVEPHGPEDEDDSTPESFDPNAYEMTEYNVFKSSLESEYKVSDTAEPVHDVAPEDLLYPAPDHGASSSNTIEAQGPLRHFVTTYINVLHVSTVFFAAGAIAGIVIRKKLMAPRTQPPPFEPPAWSKQPKEYRSNREDIPSHSPDGWDFDVPDLMINDRVYHELDEFSRSVVDNHRAQHPHHPMYVRNDVIVCHICLDEISAQGPSLTKVRESVSNWFEAVWEMFGRIFSIDLSAHVEQIRTITNFNALCTAMRNGFWIAEPILDFCSKAINYGSEKILGRKLVRQVHYDTLEMFKKFQEQELAAYEEYRKAPDHKTASVHQAICKANISLPRRFIDMPKDVRTEFTQFWTAFSRRDKETRGSVPPTSKRVEPVGIYIWSDPGLHKTIIRDSIVEGVSALVDLDSSKYVHNISSDYWSAYSGQTWTLFEEFFQQTDGQDRTELARTILELIGTGPYPLNMPFEGKGEVFFTSKFVVGTTNTDPSLVQVKLAQPQALWRRFPFVIRVKCPEKYKIYLDKEKRTYKVNLPKLESGVPDVNKLDYFIRSLGEESADSKPGYKAIPLRNLVLAIADHHRTNVSHYNSNETISADSVFKMLGIIKPIEPAPVVAHSGEKLPPGFESSTWFDPKLKQMMRYMFGYQFSGSKRPSTLRTFRRSELVESHSMQTEHFDEWIKTVDVNGSSLLLFDGFDEHPDYENLVQFAIWRHGKNYDVYIPSKFSPTVLSVKASVKGTFFSIYEKAKLFFSDSYSRMKDMLDSAVKSIAKVPLAYILHLGKELLTVLALLGTVALSGTMLYHWWTRPRAQGVAYDKTKMKLPTHHEVRKEFKVKAATPKGVIYAQASSPIRSILTRHCGHLVTEGDLICKYFAVGGRDILINLHTYSLFSETEKFRILDIDREDIWYGAITDCEVRVCVEADIACIRLPKSVKQWKECAHLFIQGDDIEFIKAPLHKLGYNFDMDYQIERVFEQDMHIGAIKYRDQHENKYNVYCLGLEVPGIPGDCMEPYWSESPQLASRQIIGVHCSGSGTSSYCSIITQELLTALRDFPLAQGYVHLVPPDAKILQTKVKPGVHPPLKTRLEPSPYYGKLGEVQDAPAVLAPTPTGSPIGIALSKVTPPDITMTDAQEKILAEISKTLLSDVHKSEKTVKPLSRVEAVLGLGPHFPPLHLDTSPGYPFSTMKPFGTKKGALGFKNRDWIKIIRDEKDRPIDVEFDPFLAQQITALEEAINSSGAVDLDAIFTVFPKDETRPLQKVADLSTRMVNGCPLHLTIVVRMYLGPLLYEIHRNRNIRPTNAESKVGMAVESYDIVNFVNNLLCEGRFFDFDFSKFDTKQSWKIAKWIAKAVCDWYGNKAMRLPLTNLLRSIWNAKYILGDVVYELFFQLASGWPGTADFNGLYNILATHYVIIRVARDFGHNWSAAQVKRACWLAVYGDDSVLRTPDLGCFEYAQFIRAYAELGLIATSGSKTDITLPFLTGRDVVFLKRKLVFHNDAPFLAREISAIRGGLNWCFKSANVHSQHQQIARTMVRDIAPYGPEEHKRLVTELDHLNVDLLDDEHRDFQRTLAQYSATQVLLHYN